MEHRLTYAASASGSARRLARDFVRGQLAPDRADDFVLMVSEVVSNAVCHGQPDQDGRIGLRLEAERGVVRAVVSDGAPEFSYRRDAVEAVEGVPHGLFMVDKLADRWGLSLDGKKAVWFEVDTRARAAYGSQGGKALALLR